MAPYNIDQPSYEMDKNASLRLLMKVNPSLVRKLIMGRPAIKLFSKMSPLVKAKLTGGRKLLEAEKDLYKKIISMGVRKGLQDKALIGAAAGSALGAGSLGWALAKENPETDSRLAKLLTAFLFEPEGKQEQADQQDSSQEQESIELPQIDLPGFFNSNEINWEALESTTTH